MSKPIDELVVQIKADTKQLQKDLKQVQGKLKTTGVAGGAAFGGMAGAMSKAKVGAIGVTAALVGVGVAVTKVAQVGMGFEDLKDSLNQVFGSMEAGDQAMKKVFKFAQTTPFQIEDATKAFIQLKSAGIEPSMDMLQTFADTASTSIDQLGAFESLIRIVQRSAAGGMGLEEINQLDDRGIPATKILTEALGKSRDELSEFGKTAEGAAEMVRLLIAGLETRFGGAMADKMDNLSTKSSNMSIAFKQLADAVFTGGLGERLKKLTDRLTGFADEAARAVRVSSGKASLGDLLGDTTGKVDQLPIELRFDVANIAKNEAFDKLNKAKKQFQDAEDAGFTGLDIIQFQANLQFAQKEFDDFKKIVDGIIAEKVRLAESNKKEIKVETFSVGDIDGLVDFQSRFAKIADDMIPETQKIQDEIDYLKDLMTFEGADLEGILKFLKIDNINDIQEVITHLENLKTEINDLPEAKPFENLKDLTGINSLLHDTLSDATEGADLFVDELKNMTDEEILAKLEEIPNLLERFGLTSGEALSHVKAFKNELKDLDTEVNSLFGDLENLENVNGLLNEQLANGNISLEQANALFREYLTSLGPVGTALANLGTEIEGLADSFADDLTTALLEGEDALDSFKNFAEQIVSAIISEFMRLLVIRPIVDGVLGYFNMSTGTGTGTGSSRGGGGQNLAGGGTIQGGTPTLVGERGAEIFVPNTGGTIMNNMNTKNAMGGGTPVNIYQTVNFATGIVPTVRAEVTKMMPQIADVTKAAVQESAMRGGNFRRSLVGG